MLQRRIAIRTRELIRKNDLLDLQLNELSKNNELKNRLISIISHNIITPLRYMHRAATSLKEGRLLDNPDLALRATVSIKDTAIELEQLSINLLNWIKFQHSQEQLQPEAFDVQEVIKQAVNLITPLCREKGLAQQLLNTEACSIRQYKDAMQVILYNLLINAVNYSNAGTVTVNLMCTTEYADLIVSDNGPGISAKMIERLTSDKVHETLGPLENKGLGFGYQIISDLLRLCGSSISIQSEGGTTVTVRFPCLPPEKLGINSAD